MKKKRSKLISMLLTLVMTLSLVPAMGVTASAADNHPEASNVFVDGGKSFYNNRLYYKKGDQDKNFTGNEGDYIAHYNPATGTLTLNGYSGGSISVGGVKCSDITVVLKGTNTINGSLENAVGGDITVTSSDGGTLSISKTTSGSNSAIGIETGLSASYTTGNVTIKGNAKVTINMTHNGTSTYEKAYGIFAKENITISENASVDITCATPNNTTGGGNCNGLYAAKDVTIDTNGTIKIDVTNAGKDKDNGYSYGVYHMRTATLTKVGNMEVQWKKEGNSTRYSGGAFTRGATFSDTDHAINEDTTNCYASYRYGTSYYTVTVQNGTLTGTGVKYANGSGKFLAGDMVSIKPSGKKSHDNTPIPFKKWTSEGVALASPTMPNTSFNVPTNDVTVTATYNPFDGAPVFTRTSDSSGTIKFKTVANPDNSEFFEYVKDGETAYNRPYSQPTTTSSASPYEYSVSVSTYYAGDIKNLEAGDYRMAVTLNGERYLSDLFTVNYTAAPATKTLTGISVTTAPDKTIYTAGDNFDSTGMVVTAEYNNGDTAEVTSYTVTDGNNLAEGKTSVTISYTENGETKNCTQAITVNAAAHTHTWETDWSKDEMQHWHKCTGCDAKKDVENHSGGTATCTAQAECLVCGVSYGALNPNNHSGTTGDWKTNESQHWKVYNCCNAEAEKANHVYDNDKDTTCNTCGYVRTIAPTKIAVPTAKTGLVYDGNEKIGVEAGEGYTLSGTFKETDAGDYTATAALETDYKWNDGTTEPKTISWSIDRAIQEAPSGLAGVAPTTAGGSDGKITGTTADMEYSTDAAFALKVDCADTETTGLEAGTYYVRYKEKTNYYAGTAATVTVGEGTPVATYTLTVNEGTGSGDYAENVIVTIQANAAATGKQFKEWTGLDSVEFVDGTSKTSATAKFKMPAKAVTATATYEDVVTPPSHTHTYDGTWKFDENQHWKECADTSCDNLTGSVKEEAPHSFAEVVTPATPTTDGKKESKCSVCGYVGKTETINATGYKITFDAKGGTLTATELHTDRTGKLASLPTATRSGYTFDGWFTEETGGEKVTTEKTFNADATLYAYWTAKSSSSSGGGGGGGSSSVTKYAVTISSADNGKVTSDKTRAAKDSVVTITTKANDGYVLDTIKATDKAGKKIKLTDKGDGKYTFTMPASKVEVKAAFKQTASKPGKPAEEMKTVVVMQVGSKTMFVNGKAYEKDAAPVIMNDRTLVPIRFVTESLGGKVAWNAETKEVTLVIDGKEIKMTIGKTIEKYGVAPVIIDSRTFVPVRFVADELGATTAWNAETKTVTITKAVTPVKTEK